ncbi:MAG: hypothetical protein QM681_14130, partial [Novosphingobium sp.]
MTFDTADIVIPDQHAGHAAHFDGTKPSVVPAKEPLWQPSPRYADQPMSWRTRLFGAGGTTMIGLLILGGALFAWTSYQAAPVPTTLSAFDVAPPAAPPSPQAKFHRGRSRCKRKRHTLLATHSCLARIAFHL